MWSNRPVTSTIRVRPARRSDEDLLARFNAAQAWETERIRLDPRRLRRGVRAALRDPRKGMFLVAERGGEVAGMLMVTFEWSDWRNGVFWWIQSVYVAPQQRRSGVMRALFSDVRRRARQSGRVCGLRLYVEKSNRVAQKTYRALGLREAPYRMFEDDFVLRR